MTTLYIVVESGGEYESYWEHSVAAFITKEAAEEDIAKRVAEDTRLRELAGIVIEWADAYEAQNPRPIPDRERMMARHAWPAGLGKGQITDEMRAERKRIEGEARKATKEFNDAHMAWLEKALVALNMKHKELGLEPAAFYNPRAIKEDTGFDIDEVPLIGATVVPNQ